MSESKNSTFMNKYFTRIIAPVLLVFPMTIVGANYEVSSPDGKTVVTISDDGNSPSYSVKYDGKDFILKSPLGLTTNIGDYTAGLNIIKAGNVEHVSRKAM